MSYIEHGSQPPIDPEVKAEQRLVNAVSGKGAPKIFSVMKVKRPNVRIEEHDSRSVENEDRTHTFIVPGTLLVAPKEE